MFWSMFFKWILKKLSDCKTFSSTQIIIKVNMCNWDVLHLKCSTSSEKVIFFHVLFFIHIGKELNQDCNWCLPTKNKYCIQIAWRPCVGCKKIIIELLDIYKTTICRGSVESVIRSSCIFNQFKTHRAEISLGMKWKLVIIA